MSSTASDGGVGLQLCPPLSSTLLLSPPLPRVRNSESSSHAAVNLNPAAARVFALDLARLGHGHGWLAAAGAD